MAKEFDVEIDGRTVRRIVTKRGRKGVEIQYMCSGDKGQLYVQHRYVAGHGDAKKAMKDSLDTLERANKVPQPESV